MSHLRGWLQEPFIVVSGRLSGWLDIIIVENIWGAQLTTSSSERSNSGSSSISVRSDSDLQYWGWSTEHRRCGAGSRCWGLTELGAYGALSGSLGDPIFPV